MTILISGGSKGLGLAMARHYLKEGYKVATFARRITQDILTLRGGYQWQFFFEQVDAQDSVEVEHFVQRARERLGPIRCPVNNAAIGQDSLLAGMDSRAIGSIIDINLAAPIALTRVVVRQMLLNNIAGRIVNISSLCALKGYAGLSVYSAAKAGLEAFTRSLAVELGPRKIQVNAIAPGFFASEMSGVLAPEQVQTIERRTPMGRLCTPKDILPVLDLLLLGEHNIAGQVFHIDGGASS